MGSGTAIGIGQVESRAGQLIRLGPRQRADGRLQRASHAIGKTIVENAIAGPHDGFVVAERIPRNAHARHDLTIVDGGDAGGHARIAGEQQPFRRVRIDRRLHARRPRVHAIPNIDVGRVHLVSKAEVESQA